MILNVTYLLLARRLPCPQASTGAFVSTPSVKELAHQPCYEGLAGSSHHSHRNCVEQ